MTEALAALRAAVLAAFGLRLQETRDDELASLLEARRGLTDPLAYVASMGEPTGPEWAWWLERLTVGESYFFRDMAQWSLVLEHVVPALLRSRAGSRKLTMLFAGCSGGEEPYTMAILLKERWPELEGWDVRLVGVDVDRSRLARARAGRFQSWALRGEQPAIRAGWFTREGDMLVLAPEIRRQVHFEWANLVAPGALADYAGLVDVVFCRNVMIYLSAEGLRAIADTFLRVLRPDGYLLLGPAESLRGVSSCFTLERLADGFCYRPHGAPTTRLATAPPPTPGLLAANPLTSLVPPAPPLLTGAARAPSPPPPPPAPPPPAPAPAPKPAPPRRPSAPPTHRGLPTPPLAAAAEALRLGRLDDAERACNQAIAADEFDACAHHLLALAREQAGDLTGAARQDELAIYLDPRFALPHLHRGLLASQAGDGATARREVRLALELLPAETPERLALFGGHGREALERLCRSELARWGEAR